MFAIHGGGGCALSLTKAKTVAQKWTNWHQMVQLTKWTGNHKKSFWNECNLWTRMNSSLSAGTHKPSTCMTLWSVTGGPAAVPQRELFFHNYFFLFVCFQSWRMMKVCRAWHLMEGRSIEMTFQPFQAVCHSERLNFNLFCPQSTLDNGCYLAKWKMKRRKKKKLVVG